MERSAMTVSDIIIQLTLLGCAASVGYIEPLTVIPLRSIPAFIGGLTIGRIFDMLKPVCCIPAGKTNPTISSRCFKKQR